MLQLEVCRIRMAFGICQKWYCRNVSVTLKMWFLETRNRQIAPNRWGNRRRAKRNSIKPCISKSQIDIQIRQYSFILQHFIFNLIGITVGVTLFSNVISPVGFLFYALDFGFDREKNCHHKIGARKFHSNISNIHILQLYSTEVLLKILLKFAHIFQYEILSTYNSSCRLLWLLSLSICVCICVGGFFFLFFSLFIHLHFKTLAVINLSEVFAKFRWVFEL